MAPKKSKDNKKPAEKADEQAMGDLKSAHAAEYDELRKRRMEKLKEGQQGA